MAMQSGIGLSKILIIAGAGYTGTVLIKNRKLSDLLGELQSLVKGMEKSGEHSEEDHSDAIATQVRRLAMEVRQLASSRQITIMNGESGGKLTSLIMPAAAVGAVGYGYMWWKGISFSDLFWVTKRSMAIAVESLTKNLESVSDALSAAKKHLTQRIQNLDDKMDTQKEISKNIQLCVEEARNNLGNIECDLDELQRLISGLDGKVGTLEYKQDLANAGVWYLCNMVGGKKTKMPEALQVGMEQLKLSSKSRSLLTNSGLPSVKGLKDIMDTLPENVKNPGIAAITLDGSDNLDDQPKSLQRTFSARC